MITQFEKTLTGREMFTRDDKPIAIKFEECTPNFPKDVEDAVKIWLKDDTAGQQYHITILDENCKEIMDYNRRNVYFTKTEIAIKTCSNCWDIYRIATSFKWPNLISVFVKTIGLNDYKESDIATNEIRGDNYDRSPSTEIKWIDKCSCSTQQLMREGCICKGL